MNKHKSILLIEEDDSESSKIKSWVNMINVNNTIYHVKDCKLGLDLLSGNSSQPKIRPDIILVNIYAPVMDGLEFLGIIRNYSNFRNIKVYFLVPGMDADDSTISFQFQVEGLLSKPFELNFKDKESLSLKKLSAELISSGNLKLSSFIGIPVFLRNFFEKLLNGFEATSNAITKASYITLLKSLIFSGALAGLLIITAAKTYIKKGYMPVQAKILKPGTSMKELLNSELRLPAKAPVLKAPLVNNGCAKKKPVCEKRLESPVEVIVVDSLKPKNRALKIVAVEENESVDQSETYE